MLYGRKRLHAFHGYDKCSTPFHTRSTPWLQVDAQRHTANRLLPSSAEHDNILSIAVSVTTGFAPQTEDRHRRTQGQEWDSKRILQVLSPQVYQYMLPNDCRPVCVPHQRQLPPSGFPTSIRIDWEPYLLLPLNTPPRDNEAERISLRRASLRETCFDRGRLHPVYGYRIG